MSGAWRYVFLPFLVIRLTDFQLSACPIGLVYKGLSPFLDLLPTLNPCRCDRI